MSDTDRLGELDRRYLQAKRSYDALTSKINRLDAAYDALTVLKDEYRYIRESFERLLQAVADYGEWTGDNYNGFYGDGTTIIDLYKSMEKSLDDAHDAIHSEMTRLRNKRSPFGALMRSLTNEINNWIN